MQQKSIPKHNHSLIYMSFSPTIAQQKIYEFIQKGNSNGIIDAVAGAGKTTTLMECVDYILTGKTIVFCAFNTSIKKEIATRFRKDNKNVAVATIHSLGFQMLRATGKFRVEDSKYKMIIKEPEFLASLEEELDSILALHGHISIKEIKELESHHDTLDWEERNNLNEGQQYVRKILSRLLDINQKYRCTLAEDTIEAYESMIRHFAIIPLWEQNYPTYPQELKFYFQIHQKLLKEGNSMAISHGIIDYTDQIYLPFVLNLVPKLQYDFVFVDECQDLSKAQVEVVRKYVKDNGRILAVGDPYQAIYGFAGADCDSFERVKNSFGCKLLKLSDCFRCPQDVITLTQSLRSDIKGFKQYPGKIYHIPFREVVINIKEGDLVICRTRLPLRSLALKLINKDFKVKIHPDELEEFLGDYKRNFTSQEMRLVLIEEMIDSFFENVKARNRKRIERENKNADPIIRQILIREETEEMESTIDFLKKKYFDWRLNTLECLLRQLKHRLSSSSEKAIRLSTIHRAKGLENDRVFILEYDKLPPARDLEWEQIQERNLFYVALTRPKEELYLCGSQLLIDSEDPDENTPLAQPVNVNEVLETVNKQLSEASLTGNNQYKNDMIVNDEGDEPLIEGIATHEVYNELAQNNPTRPSIPIRDIQKISKIPQKFYSFGDYEDTPYPSLNARDSQKAKYWSIYNHLLDSDFRITNVVCTDYLDTYYIHTPNGIEIYRGSYKANGQYNFAPQGNCVNSDQLLKIFHDESNYHIYFEYDPAGGVFETIHQLIQSECQEHSICNTNIYEENYALVYCFKTINSYAYLKLTYNGKNIVTYITPFSSIGNNDEVLKLLLESIKHIWQA